MEKDIQSFVIKALADLKEKLGKDMPSQPGFMVKPQAPDKVRLIFNNKVEPPDSFVKWTVITVTIEDFSKMTQAFPTILEHITKPK